MKIVRAQSSGFCFGVRNAVTKAYDLIEDSKKNHGDKPMYMLGELIHNKIVINELNQGGMKTARL